MKTAIVGASGYSGEELIRLLSQHPVAELCAVTSRSLAGQKVVDILPKLSHSVGDLTFTESSPKALAENKEIETVFLALPHGVSFEYAEPLYDAGKTIIDLSADFRLNSRVITKNITAKNTQHLNYWMHLHTSSQKSATQNGWTLN